MSTNALRSKTALTPLLAAERGQYMAYHKAAEGFDGCYLHDPMAVCLAIARDMFETIPARVDIETQGELTRGMTVARLPLGGRGESESAEANAEVALRVDARRFLALFRSRIWKP